MEKYKRDIILLKKVPGEPVWHDPLYEQVSYDINRDIFRLDSQSPPKAFMHFARPIHVAIRQWDPVSDGWDSVFIDEYDSYHRPSDFYDHYYSSIEIENLKNKDIFIKNWLTYCTVASYAMKDLDIYMYKSHIDILTNMILHNKTYIEALHDHLDVFNYRIVKGIPLPQKFQGLPFFGNCNVKHFDETWNTADYFHLFLPKHRMYFVNPEKLTCTCLEFNKNKRCTHIIPYVIKRVLYKFYDNVQLVTDLTPLVLMKCL